MKLIRRSKRKIIVDVILIYIIRFGSSQDGKASERKYLIIYANMTHDMFLSRKRLDKISKLMILETKSIQKKIATFISPLAFEKKRKEKK